MPAMAALRLHKSFTHAHEPKHAAFFVVQIHQLQHHLGRGRRGVERLVELRFQRGGFLIHGTGHRRVCPQAERRGKEEGKNPKFHAIKLG